MLGLWVFTNTRYMKGCMHLVLSGKHSLHQATALVLCYLILFVEPDMEADLKLGGDLMNNQPSSSVPLTHL